MRFPIRVKNFSNPESFEKSLEQNAAKPGKKFPDRATMIKKLVDMEVSMQKDEKFSENLQILKDLGAPTSYLAHAEEEDRQDVYRKLKELFEKDFRSFSDKQLQDHYSATFSFED